jgi:plasmid maintenance system antidote protein VapI
MANKRPQPLTDQLRDAIRCVPVTPTELARHCSLDKSSRSRFLSGERGLTATMIDRVAAELGLQLTPIKPAKRPMKKTMR